MKKKWYNLLGFVLILTIACISCEQQTFKNDDQPDNNIAANNLKSTGLSIDEEQEILELAILDLVLNTDIKTIISDAVLDDDYEHIITLPDLYDYTQDVGIDLIDLMETSFINNGGEQSDLEHIENIVYEYLDHAYSDIIPLIYIPYADLLSFTNYTPYVSKINVFDRDSTFTGYEYDQSVFSAITLTSVDVSNNPCWIISHQSLKLVGAGGAGSYNGGGGMPFRRCWCTRDNTWVNDDGQTIYTSWGSCICTRKDKNNCCQSICDRAGWNGECSGEQCSGC